MTTALYRRYRPDSFTHVIGQEHVTDPLRAALRANKVTHAYLFSGPRGCGKTTSARILARCLNCAQGPTDTPCGMCDSCKELATGGPGSLDVVEIDAASHGGVDDARELRERATFAPVRDRYKVFIIDEAHMVTPQGFNALLKLVEEPPEHVKFVFATTEPDRVLGTIRSRTHHYPFRLVPPDALEPYLAQLSEEEGIHVAPGVLNLVIRAGGGSVRDTLSVLDQLMAGTVDATLGYHQAVALLGYTDSALLDETVDALAGGDGAAAYRVVERMVESGHAPRRFVEDLLQRLRDLLIISVAGESAADVLTGTPADQLERMKTQARNWGPRHLSRAADLTDHALRAMVGATSPRLQLELLIGRILVPAPSQTDAEPPLPGTVGMAGGGAPRESNARTTGSTSATDTPRFGAAQAREELRRRRQAESSPTNAPVPHPATTPTPTPEPAPSSRASRQTQTASVPGTSPLSETIKETSPSPERSTEPPTATPPSEKEKTPAPGGPTHTPPGGEQTPPPPTSAEASAPNTQDTPGEARTSGRDSDMLRQRWPEVIERLSSISRVAWSLLRGNGQLGGVDGTTAIVLLPTEGMVENFTRGQRAADVERAIHEATGLTLTVIAQVGQASGGAQVTTPSISPTPPRHDTREEVSAPADDFRSDTIKAEDKPPLPSESRTPDTPTESLWPEAVKPPQDAAEYEHNAPASQEDSGIDPFAPAPPHALAAWATSTDDHAQEKTDHERRGDDAPPHAISTVEDIPTTPPQREPLSSTPTPASALEQKHAGASSVFGDDIYGDDTTGTTSPNHGDADRVGSPRPHLSHINETHSPVTKIEEPPHSQVSAAEDDSASIDDADVENSHSYGLPAIFEILGGKVIDEVTTEGGW